MVDEEFLTLSTLAAETDTEHRRCLTRLVDIIEVCDPCWQTHHQMKVDWLEGTFFRPWKSGSGSSNKFSSRKWQSYRYFAVTIICQNFCFKFNLSVKVGNRSTFTTQESRFSRSESLKAARSQNFWPVLFFSSTDFDQRSKKRQIWSKFWPSQVRPCFWAPVARAAEPRSAPMDPRVSGPTGPTRRSWASATLTLLPWPLPRTCQQSSTIREKVSCPNWLLFFPTLGSLSYIGSRL